MNAYTVSNRMIVAGAVGLAVLGWGTGCATAPPRELQDARAQYGTMQAGTAPRDAPADATAAKKAMDAANAEWDRDGDCDQTRDLADVAERKAEYAETQANIAQNTQRLDRAQQQLADAAVTNAAARRQAMADAQQREAEQQQNAENARQANAQQTEMLQQQLQAEREHSEEAMQALSRVATVRHEPRGMVVDLSGSLLFETGKFTLRPTARARLEKVAAALKEAGPDEKFIVEGHTDSRGSDELNQTLSEHRADSVKSFLVAQGVPEAQITSVGMGKEDPIATNRTAEGRADNRRVDIVMQGAPTPRG